MSKPTMNTQDAVSANFAECFVTIDGTRYSMLMAKEFEGTASVNTAEVYKLGGVVVGHKAQTVALSFSMTIYKCTEIFDKVVEDFIKTGVMPTFDIQTSNDDPATTVGRSTKIYNNCILDGDVLLSMFNAEGDFVEQSIEGYCDSFTRPEQYRVRSYDSYNATSTYVTSETRTVDNNAIPVITSSTTSGTDLGTKEDGFDLTYTVTDADNDTVTVKEYLDDVLKRTYTATLGQSNTVQCVTAANWQKVLNGAHTIKVVANDTKADSTPYTVTFTKAVYEASITLAEPMEADDTITVMVLNVLGSIPADADLEVLVTNNANDTEPVWEDATQDVKNGNNHVFTNQTATNGFAFNFKVNVGRGTSNTGGYITSIGGAFQ